MFGALVGGMGEQETIPDNEEMDRRREEGCRREEAIRSLLKRHGVKRLTMNDVKDVAWELGVSRATTYRLVKAYRANGTVSSVEPRSRGRRQDCLVLDRKREKLIALAIQEIYLKPERPTMTYLIEQVGARCAREGLPQPHYRTIKARVDQIDRRAVALKRKDSKVIKATKAVPGQYTASRPL
jgi:putative transposase